MESEKEKPRQMRTWTLGSSSVSEHPAKTVLWIVIPVLLAVAALLSM